MFVDVKQFLECHYRNLQIEMTLLHFQFIIILLVKNLNYLLYFKDLKTKQETNEFLYECYLILQN